MLQCYATADLGLIAYESEAREGLILGEEIIVEILRPGTGEPLPDGEVGEVVVTTINADYPLLSFDTGELSATMPGTSTLGGPSTRTHGSSGHAEPQTQVKGMFGSTARGA